MAEEPTRKLAVLLHADVVGSTALVQLNETLAHARIQDVFHRFSETIEVYGGTTNELRGDALVAEFGRASDAVCAALAFQNENRQLNDTIEGDIRPQLRVGIAIGEVVIADNTVTGPGVVVAQRLEQLTDPNGVCIQDAAYQTVPTRLAFEYRSLGEQILKGFDGTVLAYTVSLGQGAIVPPPEEAGTPIIARTAWTNRRWLLAGIAGVIVAVAALVWWQPWKTGFKPATIEGAAFPLPDRPSIAVLPLTNLSGDAEQEYFADGMTDDLITDLSNISGLFVISRNSTFLYKGKAVAPGEVAKDLGVRYILEGSVRRSGDQIRINAQLIDATTEGHVWAERYDRDYAEIFKLQDEVIAKIASALEVTLTGREKSQLAKDPTENLDAYELYLRAGEDARSFDLEHLTRAIGFYRKAIKLDLEFADAYAGYARVLAEVLRLDDGEALGVKLGSTLRIGLGSDLARRRGYENANRALALDPSAAQAHSALGVLQLTDGLHDEALASVRKAVSLSPSSSEAYVNLAIVLGYMGRTGEAVAAIEFALRLDPNPAAIVLITAGEIFFMDRQFDRALEPLKTANALHHQPPDYSFTRHGFGCPALWCIGGAAIPLAMTYAELGRLDEATVELKPLFQDDNFLNVQYFRVLYAHHKHNPGLESRLDAMRKAGLPEWPGGFKDTGLRRLDGAAVRDLIFGKSWSGLNPRKHTTFHQTTSEDGAVTYFHRGSRYRGVVTVEGDQLCYRIPDLMLGRKFCGFVYQNPDGTPEKQNEYIAVDVYDVHHFSLSSE